MSEQDTEVSNNVLTPEQTQLAELTEKLEQALSLMEPMAIIMTKYEFNELHQASPLRGIPEEELQKIVMIDSVASKPLLTFGQIKAISDFVKENKKSAFDIKGDFDDEYADMLSF